MTLFEMLAVLSLVAGPVAGQGLPGAAAVGFAPGGQAQERVQLQGNVHRAVRDRVPTGHADPGMAMERMILSFRMRPEARARLEHLLADQQDPASAGFHRWLTPEQFGARFGPSRAELDQVTGWLKRQGFTIDEVAPGGMSLQFSGDVGLVEQAFRTPIMEYRLAGLSVHANAGDPSIPAELAPLVAGVVSLHNIPRKAANTGGRGLSPQELARIAGGAPQWNDGSGDNFLNPGDFSTIYNVGPLYQAGVTGAGATIAIVGRTHYASMATNWQTFRSDMGLPSNPPAVVVNTEPGDLGTAEDMEADLDVEWSGAVARSAAVKFVCSASTGSSDGIDLSAQYIVNHNLADVMSTSFGSCESDMTQAGFTFYSNLWSQAAAQGISVFVASGDSGAAGCDAADASSGTTLAVNGLASTVYDICVGGTQFAQSTGAPYWSTTANLGGGSLHIAGTSALAYVPEDAWNESGTASGGSQLWSSGGGVSLFADLPSWQVAPGVPTSGKRAVPDVALAASTANGYIIYTNGSSGLGYYVVGGTSAASPAFAGLMALIVQRTGQRQGNANPTLYQLGSSQYGQGGAAVFHDVTKGDNSVPGLTGFPAGAGYDEVTGLGSVDAEALVNNWVGSISAPLASAGLLTGRTAVFSVTVDTSNYQDSTVTWSSSGGVIVPGSPSTSASFHADAAGTYTITASLPAIPPKTASMTIYVHDPDLMGSGSTVTGLDILDLLGHYGTSGTATDLDGDGVVDAADLSLLLQLLGWN